MAKRLKHRSFRTEVDWTNRPSALSRRQRQRGWAVNRPLLYATVLVLVVLIPVAKAWHQFQLERNADALLEHASESEREEEWREVAAQLFRYLQIHPDNGEVRARLATAADRSARNLSQKRRAIELYAHAIGMLPKRTDLVLRRAELLLELQQFTSAMKAVEPVLATESNHSRALRILALGLGGRGRIENSADLAEAILTLQRAVLANKSDCELAKQLAALHRQRATGKTQIRERAAADAVMDRLVEANADSPEALLARYRYRKQYGLNGSDEDLDKAISLASRDPAVILAAAGRANEKQRHADARSFYEQLTQVSPLDRRGYLGIAETWLAENQPKEAIMALEQGRSQVGAGDLLLSRQLATVLLAMGRVEESGKVLDVAERAGQVLAQQLNNVNRLQLHASIGFLRSQWHMAKGNYPAAIELLKTVLTVPPVGSENEQLFQEHVFGWAKLAACYGALENWDLAATAFERAASLAPKESRWRLSAARAWESAGRLASAVNNYEQATLAPESGVEAFVLLATARLQQQLALPSHERRWTEFMRSLASARQHSPNSPQLILLDAQFAHAQGRTGEAVRYLKELEEIAGNDQRLWQTLVLTYQQWDRPADADRVAALPVVGDDAYLLRAELLLRRGKVEDAIGVLRNALTQVAADQQGPLEVRIAHLELAARNKAAALERLAHVVAKNERSIPLLSTVGLLIWQGGELPKLRDVEERLHKQEGQDGCWWRLFRAVRLIDALPATSASSDAEIDRLESEIAALRPAWPNAFLLKGMFAEKRGQTADAIGAYRRVLDLGGRQPMVLERLVRLLIGQQRWKEADDCLRMFDVAAPLSPEWSTVAVAALVRSGEYARAAQMAQDAARRNPHESVAQAGWGEMLLTLRRTNEAEKVFRDAVAEHPHDARLVTGWVTALAREKRSDEARQVLETWKTREQVPANQRCLVLAQGYEQIGDDDQANRYYREALHAAPRDVGVRQRAMAFFTAARTAEAEVSLREMLAADPDLTAARQSLAFVLASRGTEQAWREGCALLDHAGTFSQDTAGDRRLQARLLLRRETIANRHESMKILEELVSDPRTCDASDRVLLASLYEREGKIDLARDQLATLVQEQGKVVVCRAAYLAFLLRQGLAKNVPEQLEILEQLAPHDLVTLSLKARWLKASNRQAEIEPLLQVAAQKQLEGIDTPETRGALLFELARLGDALDLVSLAEPWYRQAVELTPLRYAEFAAFLFKHGRRDEGVKICLESTGEQEPERLMTLCRLIMRMQAAGDSLPQVESALTSGLSKHSDRADLLFTVATLRYLQQRWEEARALYAKVLQLDARHCAALNNLASLLSEHFDRQEEALEYAQRALALSGPQPDLLDTLGSIQLRLGNTRQAIKVLEEVCALADADPRNMLHLAVAYDLNGEAPRCGQWLAKAREAGLSGQPLTEEERNQLMRLSERPKSP